MKDEKSGKATVNVRPRSFGTVRFGSRSMPALTTALIPGLASSIVQRGVYEGRRDIYKCNESCGISCHIIHADSDWVLQ